MYYNNPSGNYSEMGLFFTYSKCGCCGCEFDLTLFLVEIIIYVWIIIGLYYGYKFVKSKIVNY